jgi:LPXTG-site transpeptidase (sortase) family protein
MLRRLLALLFISAGLFIIARVLAPTTLFFLETAETEIISPQTFFPMPRSERKPFSEAPTAAVPSEFFLTIEKLGIRRARVFTDVDVLNPAIYKEQLREGLGHVKGTPYPGEWGTSFIIGHSSLPFFFNPQNYKTIFSRLNELEKGDVLRVEFLGKAFVFEVVGKKIVDSWKRPEEILSGSGYQLTLMTCFPPGFTWRRLLVTGHLVNPESSF